MNTLDLICLLVGKIVIVVALVIITGLIIYKCWSSFKLGYNLIAKPNAHNMELFKKQKVKISSLWDVCALIGIKVASVTTKVK